jgi:hypothetical protein
VRDGERRLGDQPIAREPRHGRRTGVNGRSRSRSHSMIGILAIPRSRRPRAS